MIWSMQMENRKYGVRQVSIFYWLVDEGVEINTWDKPLYHGLSVPPSPLSIFRQNSFETHILYVFSPTLLRYEIYFLRKFVSFASFFSIFANGGC